MLTRGVSPRDDRYLDDLRNDLFIFLVGSHN